MSDGTGITNILEFIAGLTIIFAIFATIILIINIVAQWKLFKKADEEGVYSIIPIYRDYVFCKIIFGHGLFFLIGYLGPILISLGTVASYNSTKQLYTSAPNALSLTLLIAGAIISIAFNIIMLYKLGKAFNKSTGYSLTMALAPIFGAFLCGIGPLISYFMYLGIAFGSDTYIGYDDSEIEDNFENSEEFQNLETKEWIL